MEDEEIEYYLKAVADNYPSLLELVILAKQKRRFEGKAGFTVILMCANGQNAEVLWEEEQRRFTEMVVRRPVPPHNRIRMHRILIPAK